MATIIGLCIRVKLLQTLPRRFKIDIFVRPPPAGSTANSSAIIYAVVMEAIENPPS